MSNFEQEISNNFIQYAGMVLQSRALVDVRDGLKPSARQIFYSMYLNKLTNNRPFKKTMNAVGRAMADFYLHGDSSCEGIIMRSGQPFAMRYPLVTVKGNGGTLMESGNWAAARYTESRLSAISALMFKEIEKETIAEWRDNYDGTKVYPAVFPSKGYYNLVNGTSGIGVGAASSIPQFNLAEMNQALITLLWNPNATFEELYVAPDFATGATIVNESEIKESLKKGTGAACKIRATIEYDELDKCFVVTEMPYGTYTNTICKELEQILDDEANPGVARFNDLTGEKPLLKIYLKRSANVNRVLRFLYKNTSLQTHYGINMTMLENGRFPRVFGWKEALQAHLDHEKAVYINGYLFDLKKIEQRLHILEGLIKALNVIDEVVQLIKNSTNTAAARKSLQGFLEIDGAQADAILKITLARLTHMEVDKLIKEQEDLEAKRRQIQAILDNEELLKKEIEKGLIDVAKKFGDSRRTKVIDLEKDADEEPKEIFKLNISLTNQNNLYGEKTSTLYTQRRGGNGRKFKMRKNEAIIHTISLTNDDTLLLFTDMGNYYSYKVRQFEINKLMPIETLVKLQNNEKVLYITSISKENTKSNLIFVTEQGYIKKSSLSEYNLNKSTGAKSLTLRPGDKIIDVLNINDGIIYLLSKKGLLMACSTEKITATKRLSQGVVGMKLNSGDKVVRARSTDSNEKYITTISENGYANAAEITEYRITNRGAKGLIAQRFTEGDSAADFCFANDETKSYMVITDNSILRFNASELSVHARGAKGVKAINLTQNKKVKNLLV